VLNYSPRHEDVWRSGGIALCILNPGTRWRRVVSFTVGERPPGSLWLGGCMGTISGLDAVAKRKIATYCRVLNSSRPARRLLQLSVLLVWHISFNIYTIFARSRRF